MEIYKINHVDFQYDETEREEFLKHIASLHYVKTLELITDDKDRIKDELFKEERLSKNVSRHTYMTKSFVTIDGGNTFEVKGVPMFVKDKDGKIGLLFGHFDYGWTLYFAENNETSKVFVETTKSTYSRNTKRYTDRVTQYGSTFKQLNEPKLNGRYFFIASIQK